MADTNEMGSGSVHLPSGICVFITGKRPWQVCRTHGKADVDTVDGRKRGRGCVFDTGGGVSDRVSDTGGSVPDWT